MSAGQAGRGWNWLITRTREKPRPHLRAASLVRPRNFRGGTLSNQNDIVKGNYLMSKTQGSENFSAAPQVTNSGPIVPVTCYSARRVCGMWPTFPGDTQFDREQICLRSHARTGRPLLSEYLWRIFPCS